VKVEDLRAEVEGDVEDQEGVLRIAKIRLTYRFRAAPADRPKIDRALESYAQACPAWQSVKGCIDCSWKAEIEDRA